MSNQSECKKLKKSSYQTRSSCVEEGVLFFGRDTAKESADSEMIRVFSIENHPGFRVPRLKHISATLAKGQTEITRCIPNGPERRMVYRLIYMLWQLLYEELCPELNDITPKTDG